MKAPDVANGRLRSFIERIEKLIEERVAIQGDIKDVFSEAKGVGYDTKIIRKVIALRAMDPADRAEQETLIETYLHALEQIDRVEARVASGESIRKAAAAEGMPKSTAIRQVTQNQRNDGNGSGGFVRPSPEEERAEEEAYAQFLAADAAEIRDAAPGGCVDDGSVTAPAATTENSVVPPVSSPQAAEVPALPAKPVPDAGVGTGTEPDITLPSFLDRRPDSTKRLNVTETV